MVISAVGATGKQKKADVTGHPLVLNHVGLLFNGPPPQNGVALHLVIRQSFESTMNYGQCQRIVGILSPSGFVIFNRPVPEDSSYGGRGSDRSVLVSNGNLAGSRSIVLWRARRCDSRSTREAGELRPSPMSRRFESPRGPHPRKPHREAGRAHNRSA